MVGDSKLSGTWLPVWCPESSWLISMLLTFGYDGSMMNGLNILPSYTNYFNLNTGTLSLQTAALWIGGCLTGLTWGQVTDIIGRRPALFWAAVITTVAAIVLQAAAQNIAMFVVARILVGFGTSASDLSGPVYLAETLPFHWGGWGLGIFNDCYYVGALIAAGVTYGMSAMNSTWAWRSPSAIQASFSKLPRWLAYKNRHEDALAVVAQTYANDDTQDRIVLVAFKEIIDMIEYEKNVGEALSLVQLARTPIARKRVGLAVSAAVFSTIAGNVIASYYLGTMLDNAGVTNTTTQLQINIILNAWCLVCSIVGTLAADDWGRKPTAVASTASLTIFLSIVGALTKVYGASSNTSGVYGTVAAIFLFPGAYSFGWTSLLYLYPPEVLNYPIRANGMGVFQFALNGAALLIVFTMLIALTNIGWKTYVANGAWDVVMLAAMMYYWVETNGKTLEEIDAILEGTKRSDVPDLAMIYKGKEDVGESVTAEVDELKV